MNAREIGCMAASLAPLVQGSFVQKIRQSAQGRLFLEVRRPSQTHRVFISSEPGETRICLSDAREAAPVPPLAFQSLLRSRILGAELTRIFQVGSDRVVRMEFYTSEGKSFALVAELLGRHGNIFLLSESGVILGSAVPSSSAVRVLKPGKTYVPPDASSAPSSDERLRFPDGAGAHEISEALEAIYREKEAQKAAARALSARLFPLLTRLKKSERALAAARGDLARMQEAEGVRRQGELLKANLHLIHRGDRSVRVTEYTEEGIREAEIALNPALLPKDQAEALFRRYRRLLSGQKKAAERVASLEREVSGLRESVAAVRENGGASCGISDESAQRAGTTGPRTPIRRKSAAKKGAAPPFREYVSAAGQKIWVGKNARHNDELTFGCARGNDIWLHARGIPGSHVVIPLERGEELKESTLIDALELARHFSGFRNDAGEVSWTRVKYVRRQREGGAGAVTYSQEKTVLVRPDQNRLDRLLASMAER